jgi:hypothetical protein
MKKFLLIAAVAAIAASASIASAQAKPGGIGKIGGVGSGGGFGGGKGFPGCCGGFTGNHHWGHGWGGGISVGLVSNVSEGDCYYARRSVFVPGVGLVGKRQLVCQ